MPRIATPCLLLIASIARLSAAPPTGWVFTGTEPQRYHCAIDPATFHDGHPTTLIKSKPLPDTAIQGFGTLMQDFDATQYTGKRIRLSAWLKTENAKGWGTLWMRVDDVNHRKNGVASTIAFDNMHDGLQDRSLKGSTGWRRGFLVLDVPEQATTIYIGALLHGHGALWVSEVAVEVVGPEVPLTGRPFQQSPHPAPTNLSFER